MAGKSVQRLSKRPFKVAQREAGIFPRRKSSPKRGSYRPSRYDNFSTFKFSADRLSFDSADPKFEIDIKS